MSLGVRWFCVIFSLWFFVITTRPRSGEGVYSVYLYLAVYSVQDRARRGRPAAPAARAGARASISSKTVRVVRGDRDTASGGIIFKFIYSYLVKSDCFAINNC